MTKRKFLLIAAAVVVTTVIGFALALKRPADFIIERNGFVATFTHQECTDAAVKGYAKMYAMMGAPVDPDTLKQGAVKTKDGLTVSFCWDNFDEDNYLIIDEDGGTGTLPKKK